MFVTGIIAPPESSQCSLPRKSPRFGPGENRTILIQKFMSPDDFKFYAIGASIDVAEAAAENFHTFGRKISKNMKTSI